ncbi:hypothetical protein NE626_16165, partial [Intestinimonas massiliensis]|nr:hypothetical protein [Intestinimonas massiliensis (ex Afouda et al. 2020)]
ATLAALGMQDSAPSGGSAAQSGSVDLLARVISAEARGEPYLFPEARTIFQRDEYANLLNQIPTQMIRSE